MLKSPQAAQGACCKLYGHLAPKRNFSVPRAPWWGGWWERLVRNMKLALRKSVGSKSLTRTESVLHEVEACVNSRPLTFVSDDIDVICPLTHLHFLTGRPDRVQVNMFHDETFHSKPGILRYNRAREELLNRFWTIWSTEFVRQNKIARPVG